MLLLGKCHLARKFGCLHQGNVLSVKAIWLLFTWGRESAVKRGNRVAYYLGKVLSYMTIRVFVTKERLLSIRAMWLLVIWERERC